MEIPKIGNSQMDLNNAATKAKSSEAEVESFENRLKKAMDETDLKELKDVCKQFEGIMLNMVYKQMKATVQKSELLPEDAGREIYESMMDEKLVEEASKSGGMGLADVMYKQLSARLKNTYTPEGNGD